MELIWARPYGFGQVHIAAPKPLLTSGAMPEKALTDDTVFHRVTDGCRYQGSGFTEHLVKKATDKAVASESGNGRKTL